MGSKWKSRGAAGGRYQRKKRNYYGPKSVADASCDVPAVEAQAEPSEDVSSASARKLTREPIWLCAEETNSDDSEERWDKEDSDDSCDGLPDFAPSPGGRRVVDLTCLQLILSSLVVRSICRQGSLIISSSVEYGLGCTLSFECLSCHQTCTAPLTEKMVLSLILTGDQCWQLDELDVGMLVWPNFAAL